MVIALGSPYLIGDHPQIQNYICTYSLTPTAEISAVRALFGEIRNKAKRPLALPGVAARGFSLPWPGGKAEAVMQGSGMVAKDAERMHRR